MGVRQVERHGGRPEEVGRDKQTSRGEPFGRGCLSLSLIDGRAVDFSVLDFSGSFLVEQLDISCKLGGHVFVQVH